MRLLLVGEESPGSLLVSLLAGLGESAEVTVLDPAPFPPGLPDNRSRFAGIRRRTWARYAEARFVEAAEELRPDVVLVVKGRWLGAGAIQAVRSTGIPVALYYPDSPIWGRWDTPGSVARLESVDLVILWSQRHASLLRPRMRRVEVMPFGYDHRWFPLTPPGGDRQGIVFIGTWSPRRERFLRALEGLPLLVKGTLWQERSGLAAGPPTLEATAGQLLSEAAIGINLIHPACAGAHNMRTREISATGALQITEPGIDGTPLRDGESCIWFRTPHELRTRVEHYLANAGDGVRIARRAQSLIAPDNNMQRGRELVELLAGLRSHAPSRLTASKGHR